MKQNHCIALSVPKFGGTDSEPPSFGSGGSAVSTIVIMPTYLMALKMALKMALEIVIKERKGDVS